MTDALPEPSTTPRRIAFLGTPEIAVTTLRGLHAAGHEIVVVVTGRDTRRGRGGETTPSPVKAAALELGLPVEHDPEAVLRSGAELGVVVAFGRILSKELVEHLPMVNLHFSLLPRWRGAAPVEWAILDGDERTGVCVMAVEEGLDTGGVYAKAETEVGEKTLAGLWDELGRTGTDLLVEWLRTPWPDGRPPAPEPQVGTPTYARKLTADDRRIPDDAPAERQLAVVRIGNAWTEIDGVRVKVLEARIDEAGAFEPVTVQPEGRRPMAFGDWQRGRR